MASDRRDRYSDLNSEELRILRQREAVLNREINIQRQRLEISQDANEQERIRTEINQHLNDLSEINIDLRGRELSVSQKITKELKNQAGSLVGIGATSYGIAKTFGGVYTTLMGVDKSIRSTTRDLGLAGGKAKILRDTFESTSGYAMRLGGATEDLQTITSTFADETGRARVFSEETYKTIIAMGRGTALGVENAARLAGQYELIGVSAESAAQHTLGILETSERMGVSAANVLNKINKNFSRLRTFTFVQGVKGFEQMAIHAEKMRMDMSQALDSAEAARRLDNAIEMAAQLQVMGGEFAKTDPFELLFLSRNDPARYAERINEMTRGVVSFRKMADGTFEKFLSPADRDRLTRAAEVLGMQSNELIEQSMRMSEIQRMREEISGMGLTSKEKDLIEGIGTFNDETGKFQVKLGSTVKNINELSRTQLQHFAQQASSLDERAMAAQTFEDAFKASIEELKVVGLPILKGINRVLEAVRPTVIKFTEWAANLSDSWKNTISYVAGFVVVMKGLAAVVKATGIAALGKIIMAKKMTGAKWGHAALSGGRVAPPTVRGAAGAGQVLGRDGKPINAPAMRAWQQGQLRHEREMTELSTKRARAAKARGAGRLRTGAGIGAAGLGVGAGVGTAALGISELANSMSKLDVDQLRSLEKILLGLGVASTGIVVLGVASKLSATGLYLFAGAALMVGSAIGIAGLGVGYMAKGLGELVEKSNQSKDSLYNIAGGVAALSGAMTAWTVSGGGLIGMFSLNRVLGSIAKRSDDLRGVGDAFKEIRAVMSGSEEDFKRVESMIQSISNLEMKDKSAFGELAKLLKTPLKVEFANKEVAVVSNITLNIDGDKVAEKIGAKKMASVTENARTRGLFS